MKPLPEPAFAMTDIADVRRSNIAFAPVSFNITDSPD